MRHNLLKHVLFMTITFLMAVQSAFCAPEIINYQGKITIGETPFSGEGQFRFAIVDTPSEPWNELYWSNDGSNPPDTDVPVDVVGGVFSVNLGQIPQLPLTATVFSGDDRYLVIWFNDGVNGLQRLEPNSRLTSVGYSLHAQNATNTETIDDLDSSQLMRRDQNETLDGDLTVTGDLEVNGTMESDMVIAPIIKPSANNSRATIDFDTLPNNAQNSGVTIGKLRAIAAQNNGQPYLWLRGNGAHSWILDHTGSGTDWAQSIGAYYNDVKQGNIGFFGNGPTVDYLSIGFGHPDWWNAYSRFMIWNTGRAQFMPPETGALSLEEPDAWLVLAPGDSVPASAPIKFKPGSLLTVPEPGAVEWDGNTLFVTDESAVRHSVAWTTDETAKKTLPNGVNGQIDVVTDVTQDPVTKDISITKSTLIIENGIITAINN